MIAYFDTSALIPLLVDEPGSDRAARLWDEADHVVAVRLIYAEARAALAHATRTGRLSAADLSTAIDGLEGLYASLDLLEVDEALVRRNWTHVRHFVIHSVHERSHLRTT